MSLIHVIEVPRESGTTYSPIARLNVCSNVAGIATIDVAPAGAIEFPTEVALFAPAFESEISGVIKQSGTITVTITLNGVSDIVVIEVVALPYNISVGPETTLDYEGLPITFNMVASCDRPDTTLTLSSTGVGITIPPTVYCDGAPVEFPVTVSNYGEFTVTGEYNGSSSTADIHSINDAIKLYLEADKDIYVEDPPVTFNMRVFCSRDGEVTLSSTGANVIIPDHVDVILGVAEFPVTIGSTGLKVISAIYDVAYAECAIDVSEEAILISLGEDRHIYYNGDDITITKTVYCNKDGIVNLTQTGDLVNIPGSVLIVDGTAEFDIICSSGGTTLISAESEEEVGVFTSCEIIIEEIPIVLSLGSDRIFDNHFDPISFEMNVFCNRDGTVNLSSDHATVPETVVVTNGIGTFNVICDEDSVITAEFGGTEDTCGIELNDPPSRVLYIGPDQTISWESSEDEPTKYIILMVSSDFSGTVNLSSSDPALVVPSSVVCGGKIYVTCETNGSCDAIVTATKGSLTSSCRIIVHDLGTGGCEDCGDCTGTEPDLWTIPDDNLVDPVMFLGDAEQGFSKQIAEELMEKVVNQLIFYYPVDTEASSYHDMYGESIQKKFHPPIRVHALVEWKGYDTKNAAFSLDKVPVIEVHFAKRRLEEDQNLVVKEGDFVKYGRDFYEITALNENSELFGAFDNKLEVSATCVKARKGTFFVKDQSLN
jgi:hypothetical protein